MIPVKYKNNTFYPSCQKNESGHKKYLNIRVIKTFIIIIFAAYSCYYDNEEYLYPQPDTACDTATVTYSTSVRSLLDNNCLSCHSNNEASLRGGNIKLENYADVKLRAGDGSLLGAISHESGYSPMPREAPKLDDCSISIIRIWVNAGSPDN